MQRYKYLTSTILCTLILNACGDKGANGTNPSPAATLGPDVTSTSITVPTNKDNPPLSATVTTITPARELEATKGSVVYSKKHVIVNAANKWLAPGGLLSGAIFNAAGADNVLEEIKTKKNLATKPVFGRGPVLLKDSEVFTTGAYDLIGTQGTQYIVHALGPDFRLSPYKAKLEEGYAVLRTTYQNVYNEMDRLNREQTVTSIGIIPISGGVFSGSASKEQMFRIMIEETLDAMDRYPAIQPELYLFGQGEYATVKTLLPKVLAEKYPTTTGTSLPAATAAAAVLALNANATYQASFGNGYIKGVAHNFGPVRLVGLNSNHYNRYINTTFIGVPLKQHIMGVELEIGQHRNEITHYGIKARGIYRFSPEITFSTGIGCLNTNLSSNALTANISQLLKQFDIANLSYQTITAEMAAQYQANITASNHVTATIGFQIKFDLKAIPLPFMQASVNLGQLKSNIFATMEDVGVNLELNN